MSSQYCVKLINTVFDQVYINDISQKRFFVGKFICQKGNSEKGNKE